MDQANGVVCGTVMVVTSRPPSAQRRHAGGWRSQRDVREDSGWISFGAELGNGEEKEGEVTAQVSWYLVL